MQFGTCAVNVLYQLQIKCHTVTIFIVACNLPAKIKKSFISGLTVI